MDQSRQALVESRVMKTAITREDQARWGDLCAFAARAVLEPKRFRDDIFLIPVVDTEAPGEPLPAVVVVHRYRDGRIKGHEIIALLVRGDFNRYTPHLPTRPGRKKKTA
jgi:hypothetical protein